MLGSSVNIPTFPVTHVLIIVDAKLTDKCSLQSLNSLLILSATCDDILASLSDRRLRDTSCATVV